MAGAAIYDQEAEVLVMRAKGGDRQALEELALRYTNLISKIAVGFKTSGNLVDDLVQEGYIALLRCVKSYTPGRSFGNYLTESVRNRCRTLAKAERKVSEHIADSIDREPDVGEPIEPVDMRAERRMEADADASYVSAALSGIDGQDAFIVRLISGAETGQKEPAAKVAAVLGIRICEAEERIKQAKERCRRTAEASMRTRGAMRLEDWSVLRRGACTCSD